MHQACMTHPARALPILFAALLSLGGCADEETPENSDVDRMTDEADGDDSSPPPTTGVEAGKDGGAPDAAPSRVKDAAADGARPDAARSDDDDDETDAPDAAEPDDEEPDEDAELDEDASDDAGAEDEPDAGETSEDDAGSDNGGNDGPLVDTVVPETIVVEAGRTFDGSGKRFLAGRALGDGSQDEGQKPVFRLEDGATLKNVVLGAPAADGIHTHGDVILENIVWEDIGEDAMTIKEEGTVELRGGSATKGSDKVFQINAASVFRVSDFKASDAGKFIRQNGGTTFKVEVYIDRCDISDMGEAIFRTDSSSSSVTMTNTRYSKIGKELFMGVSPRNIVQRDNTEY